MKVLGVVSSSGETAALTERLTARLSDRGRVATVTRLPDGDDGDGAAPADRQVDDIDVGGYRAAGADATYGLGDDGWIAAGGDRALDEILEDLAPAYDYAVLAGFPGADVPQVVLGGRDHRGTELLAAPDAAAVDVDAVLDELAGTEPHETLESLVRRVKQSPRAERAGAIATFTGRVRAKDSPDDEPTEYLEFEKYEGVAEDTMEAITADLESREGVFEVRLHHRTGVVEYGEDIVFVVVLAGHREEAFRTVEDGINRLKDEVPLFKKEVTVDEEFWVHEQ